LNFKFDGTAGKIAVPDIVTNATSASFVAENKPIPARSMSFGAGKTLEPRAFKSLTTFSREALSYTNAETQVRTVLSESVGLSLDAKVFSTDAEVANTSPAGLLLDLVGKTPSATTPPSEALIDDVGDLVAAVAAVAGNSPIILVAAPKQATSLKLFFRGGPPPYEVLTSSALSAGSVIAIASNCIASVIDDTLRFDVADQAVIVMNDVGSELVAATGGVSVIADPVRSMYQTDSLALRIKFGVNWALRNATGLAFMNSVTW
jgi:hypothetical protein